MLKRITLENFMSHQRTVIEPAAGLTVIAGENNCGKSAIISAIQAVCSNVAGGYMVRHGEKECRVTIETDDDQVIVWTRKKNTVSYTLNGESIDRARGSVPPRVEAALRMCKVESGKEEFDVHFGDQKQPIFLLDKTASQRATFFASASDAGKLLEMQERHRAKVAEAKRKSRELRDEEKQLLLAVENLLPVADLQDELTEVETKSEQLAQSENEYERGRVLLERLSRQKSRCEQLKCEQDVLNKLPDFPQWHSLERIELLLSRIQTHSVAVELADVSSTVLQRLPEFPEFDETDRLQRTVRKLHQQQARCESVRQQKDALQLPNESEFLKLADRSELRQLETLVHRLRQRSTELEVYRKHTELLNGIHPPDLDETETQQMSRMIYQMNQTTQEIADHHKEFINASKREQQAHEQLHQALETLGECPTCGQSTVKTQIPGVME